MCLQGEIGAKGDGGGQGVKGDKGERGSLGSPGTRGNDGGPVSGSCCDRKWIHYKLQYLMMFFNLFSLALCSLSRGHVVLRESRDHVGRGEVMEMQDLEELKAQLDQLGKR